MFSKGFQKLAFAGVMSGSRALKSGMKMLKSPTLKRNALLGAGAGAVGGALSDKEDRLGGALKGAVGGGLAGGIGTMGYKGFQANKRFSGRLGASAKADRLSNMYKMHGQGD